MLDSTVWRQYNSENNFREFLARFTQIEILDMIEDDKELYGILKAKLTKKELKLFSMDCSDLTDEDIKKEFEYTDETLTQAKYKLYKKFKQDKIRLTFRG